MQWDDEIRIKHIATQVRREKKSPISDGPDSRFVFLLSLCPQMFLTVSSDGRCTLTRSKTDANNVFVITPVTRNEDTVPAKVLIRLCHRKTGVLVGQH